MKNTMSRTMNINRSVKETVVMMLLGLVSVVAHAEEKKQVKIEKKEQPFTVKLGSTRVIYNPDSSGATLSVSNVLDYPMLVKSQVFNEDKKTDAPFIVTPPLFRLEAQQQSRLRIVRTGGDMPTDREKLYWLCVTGIPPKSDDAWAQGEKGVPDHATLNVQISVSSCVKLMVRPAALKGDPTNVASSLTWQHQGNQLKVSNPTPFYMNLGTVQVGGKKVENLSYIPPFGSTSFSLPSGASGEIDWTLVTDFGGSSRTYKSSME